MKWELDEAEKAELDLFRATHVCPKKNAYQGAIGVSGSFIVTGTSIGEMVSYRCGACGEEVLLNGDDL